MAKIVGTVISVKEFFSTQATTFNVVINDGTRTRNFMLSANRHYVIPKYQRELRWKENNLIQLINDVFNGSKFLGNIILDKKSSTVFEVVDGQQRMTMIYLMLNYLKKKFGDQLEIFESCTFVIETFKELDLLIDKNFSDLTEEDSNRVTASDELCQIKNYSTIWEFICSIPLLNDKVKADKFIENLSACELNIIINDEGQSGVHYFLDVNTKGVQLDKEDIFKGNLFMLDSSDEVKSLWSQLKKQFEKFSNRCNNGYGLMKAIEQYLYCELYKNACYTNFSFNEEFKVDKNSKINGQVVNEGEHIICAIKDKTFMKNTLKAVSKFLSFANSIVAVDGVSDDFKRFYNSGAGLDDANYKVYHNILKKILLDSDIIPKILVLKYFLEIINSPDGKTIADYDFLFTIYTLAFLFTIFETKKSNFKINNIVKQPDWKNQCISVVKNYFSSADITDKKLRAQYKALSDTENENYEYRAKTLATIFNFFEISNGRLQVKVGQYNNLKEFITNSDKFSVEHFFVNKSGKIKVKLSNGKEEKCKYPSHIQKYKNSLFNFIFISKEKNGAMENCSLKDKLKLLENENFVECNYSKEFLKKTKELFNSFPQLSNCKTKQEAQEKINAYFNQDFIDSYISLMNEMFNAFTATFR